MQTNTHVLLEWQAVSKINHERSPQWYLITGILCIVVIVYGIVTGAWGMSLVCALLAGLFFLVRNEAQVIHSIRILETGIEFDGKMFMWSDWKHFWILQGQSYHELHIETNRRFSADIVIQTGELDPYVIRDLLSQFIPQIAHKKEKILDAIIRFCKL